MCTPTALIVTSLALTAYSGYQQAKSQREAGNAQGAYYDAQARNKELEAEYAMKIGEKQSDVVQDRAMIEVKNFKRQSAVFNSSQKAMMANMGITGVTAEDIILDSDRSQSIDEFQLMHNADMKSWNIMTDASYGRWTSLNESDQYKYSGQNARYTGSVNSRNTMLGTATSMLGSSMAFGYEGGFGKGWLK